MKNKKFGTMNILPTKIEFVLIISGRRLPPDNPCRSEYGETWFSNASKVLVRQDHQKFSFIKINSQSEHLYLQIKDFTLSLDFDEFLKLLFQ